MTEHSFDIDTIEEANRTREALANVKPKWFCPLTNGFCRADCVCYQGPYIHEGAGKYRVDKGYCGNAMFHNQCCVQ